VRRRLAPLFFLAAVAVTPAPSLARGDGTFHGAAAKILHGTPGFRNTVSIASGDFNRDGRKDLAAISGGVSVTIALQGPGGRESWEFQPPIAFGAGSFLIRAADLDADGDSDLAVADPSSTAFILWSNGDGTFQKAMRLPGTLESRWIEPGDFDGDGKIDLASANWVSSSVTIHLQRDGNTFEPTTTLPFGGEPHSMAVEDYSGDGKLDIFMGIDVAGILPLLGRGDGTFEPQKSFTGTGPCHRSIAGGDFNGDGLADLVATCGSWLNEGGGTFRETPIFSVGLVTWIQHVDVGDANGDGFQDVAGSFSDADGIAYKVFLFPGKGNGTFGDAAAWSITGIAPGSFLFEDIDGDRIDDVIASGTDGAGLSVVWGGSDAAPRDWSRPLGGISPAKEVILAEQDGDGRPDVWVLRGNVGQIGVYLSSNGGTLNGPSVSIQAPGAVDSFAVEDLDGDGNMDVAGCTTSTGTMAALYLDPHGKVLRSETFEAGSLPTNVLVGGFDGDGVADIVVPCRGSNDLAFFRGRGQGAFEAVARVPTILKPKRGVAGDLDRDGSQDLVVFSPEEIAVHYGEGQSRFGPFLRVTRDDAMRLAEVAIADFDADGFVDLIAADPRLSADRGILVFAGRGNRTFAEPVQVARGHSAPSLLVEDLDGNGFPDLVTGQSTARAVAVILNEGPKGLASPVSYGLGFAPVGHKGGDLNGDGALDLFVHASGSAAVLFGSPVPAASFRRGDADGDGAVAVNDPVSLLSSLFLGAGPVACGDGADADDSGVLDLADAVFSLNHQFLGGPEPPAPGSTACGPDDTPDAGGNDLGCTGECR